MEEASSEVDEYNPDEGWRLYSALAREFAIELKGEETDYIGLDSVYGRITSISGNPLTDGYHFGQTIVNDYGRPYQKGVNALAGFSSSGSAGVLGFYVQGEQEHAPSSPGFSQTVQDAIQIADHKGPQPASQIQSFNQFRLIDAYLSLNIAGWQTSFGKQTLWLGPTAGPIFVEQQRRAHLHAPRRSNAPAGIAQLPEMAGAYALRILGGQTDRTALGHNSRSGNWNGVFDWPKPEQAADGEWHKGQL